MRYVASLLSGAALAVALSAPAMAQQAVPGGSPEGPLLFVLPGGGVQAVQPTPQAAQPVPQMVQPNQDRVIIPAPQGGQTGRQRSPAAMRRPRPARRQRRASISNASPTS